MIKTNQQPLNLFLSGGAGVGKSRVTNAIYEALIRFMIIKLVQIQIRSKF